MFMYILITLVLYFVYRYVFKGIIFKFKGNYDTKLKNIGRPLPVYPNGWYVAMRSNLLEKGQA